MARKARWLWSWFRSAALRPGPYGTFLLGILVGSLPTETQPLLYAFWVGPIHLRIAAWLATSLLLASLGRSLYERISHRRVPRASFYNENAAPQLNDWQTDPHWLPFDLLFEVALAPSLLEPRGKSEVAGWRPTDVVLRVERAFHNAPRLEDNYQDWCRRTDPKKLEKDGIKFVLRNHPTSETDEHFVRLHLQSTRWSRVQAFLDAVRRQRGFLYQIADPTLEPGRKPMLDLSRSECPHSLGLHAVVVTSDDKILALQRPGPDRTDYYPYTWSFSFEEQLSDVDFSDQPESDVSAWLVRAVRQEVLGPEVAKYFRVEDARILGIVHEAELANPSLVALTPVQCTSQQLASILPLAPDRAEWVRFDFYALDPPYDALAMAFAQRKHVDGADLHPTSRYRIFAALSALTPPTMLNIAQVLHDAAKRKT